jgi:hypothetical protein
MLTKYVLLDCGFNATDVATIMAHSKKQAGDLAHDVYGWGPEFNVMTVDEISNQHLSASVADYEPLNAENLPEEPQAVAS